MLFHITVAVGCIFLATGVRADTPANCSYGEIEGVWIFRESPRIYDKTVDCATISLDAATERRFELLYPNVAVDEYGNRGTWTLIYNQGFEVIVSGRKFFAFSRYEETSEGVISYCGETSVGWSRDLLIHNWSCYQGKKSVTVPAKYHGKLPKAAEGKVRINHDLIKAINEKQKSWTATAYSNLEGITHAERLRRHGGSKSRIPAAPKPVVTDEATYLKAKYLPNHIDYRNISGVNYISPIRDQGNCGSCYAFASAANVEARLQVMTRNELQPVLSTQDIVSCSFYSQGCDGGFPYLIAGRYGQDFGLVEEECFPYTGKDSQCRSEKSCQRHYTAHYKYVGGYYGGCSEELMRIELVENGPFAVSFEVYPDFDFYRGGIYHHTGLRDEFNPFEITNHVVVIVGYGADETTGEPYWIVKNSWGSDWGENGFFRIRRGTDEASIESIAVSITPIPY